MGYKYELHVHTAEVSRCSNCPAAGHPEWLFCYPMPEIDVHVPNDDD